MTCECDVCGLAASDLPRMVLLGDLLLDSPELFFEQTGNVTHCPTCDPAKAPYIIRNDGPTSAGWTE